MILNIDKFHKFAAEASSSTPSAGEQLKEEFLGIFPSIPLMIATILAFIIVFAALWYFLYKPVKKMMKNRHDFIQNNIDDSISKKEESIKTLNEANAQLKNAHVQADNILTKAKLKAEKIAEFYTNQATIKSKRLLDETRLDISAQQKEFDLNSKKYIVEIATQLSEKILKREISKDTQDKIIDQFLNSDKEVEEL
ncbi:F0F1 ATP synthase subunit B [Mycoplasma sp. CSL10137]|uniref:F0F1 ATP synthase subunit B n=1 Tax=unclassified Mycoplasma TaxID=2683645 RepID=UPI00197C4D79|nr:MULTISPECIES: F0F1 ATP synthase subunit B [unclassified Mycoplasma]MBN4083391.1 F0F1 ATP synthase subunit B [Mycoplasma sp. CSL10137]MBN4084307.1 F0F1 ATP synthase subunit B [Mycoplasma sp. CSL10166]MBU4692779.1 F0F1 ATP synthase subunit B [Mycoplasma sp. CSL7491-lung]MCU4706615.1 F0F1 ATP synthase subunit B [Mycoplasma sp. CSL7503-lung]